MKILIKRFLNKYFGTEITSLLKKWFLYRRFFKNGYFGKNNIDKKLEELLPHRNGFYVELGAHDGALSSNSYFFELKKDWKGILIEPSPNLYLSCVKRRWKNNKIFCNACVSYEYKDEFVRMKYADSMTISDNLELLNIEDHDGFIGKGKKFLMDKENSFIFGAKAITLNKILLEASAPKVIDFLSLDVEGAELEVLEGLDFGMFRFKFLVIETRNISKIEEFLSEKDYYLFEKLTGHDYIFKGSSNNLLNT